jgi:lipopolysaccharide transport system permease protein
MAPAWVKVYFPRLIMPIAAALTPTVDFAIAFAILLGRMIWFGTSPPGAFQPSPLFLLLVLMTAPVATLGLSAFNVKYCDVRYTVPFLVQFWMYASQVAYPVSSVPRKWRRRRVFEERKG